MYGAPYSVFILIEIARFYTAKAFIHLLDGHRNLKKSVVLWSNQQILNKQSHLYKKEINWHSNNDLKYALFLYIKYDKSVIYLTLNHGVNFVSTKNNLNYLNSITSSYLCKLYKTIIENLNTALPGTFSINYNDNNLL